MKVGDYVRTDLGISKVKRVINEDKLIFYETDNELGNCHYSDEGIGYYFFKEDTNKVIIKSSPRIIDLIEVGDYVNGIYIDTVEKEQKRVWHTSSYGDDDIVFYNNDIKSIVTKKQFEAMEYKCE